MEKQVKNQLGKKEYNVAIQNDFSNLSIIRDTGSKT